jgi:hypothetical protein
MPRPLSDDEVKPFLRGANEPDDDALDAWAERLGLRLLRWKRPWGIRYMVIPESRRIRDDDPVFTSRYARYQVADVFRLIETHARSSRKRRTQ